MKSYWYFLALVFVLVFLAYAACADDDDEDQSCNEETVLSCYENCPSPEFSYNDFFDCVYHCFTDNHCDPDKCSRIEEICDEDIPLSCIHDKCVDKNYDAYAFSSCVERECY